MCDLEFRGSCNLHRTFDIACIRAPGLRHIRLRKHRRLRRLRRTQNRIGDRTRI